MQLSVCTDAIFAKQDTADSMRRLKSLGIKNLEFWSWWDKDIDQIDRTRQECDLQIVAICTRFVSLVDPTERERYLNGLRETIAVAERLDCQLIISQVGDELQSVSRELQQRSLIDGLRAAMPLLKAAGKTLVFEPLNTRVDHRGYYLSSSDEAFSVADQVGSENVKVLYDIYHQQVMEGDLVNRIKQSIDRIGHFHAAGNPGRHELSQGEINYDAVLEAIADTGYQGYVGLEYSPLLAPEVELIRLSQRQRQTRTGL